MDRQSQPYRFYGDLDLDGEVMSMQSHKNKYVWAFPVFLSKNVNLCYDVTMVLVRYGGMARSGDVFKMLISRLLCDASHLRRLKMEAPLLNMRFLLRIQGSLGHNHTSLMHQLMRTTKRQEMIVIQMKTN